MHCKSSSDQVIEMYFMSRPTNASLTKSFLQILYQDSNFRERVPPTEPLMWLAADFYTFPRHLPTQEQESPFLLTCWNTLHSSQTLRSSTLNTYKQNLPFLKGKLHMRSLAKHVSYMWKGKVTLIEPPSMLEIICHLLYSPTVQSPSPSNASTRWIIEVDKSTTTDTM